MLLAKVSAFVLLTGLLLFAVPVASSQYATQTDDGGWRKMTQSIKPIAGKCVGVDIEKSLDKWRGLLRMPEWKFFITCDMPERVAGVNVGLSLTRVDLREAIIFISPNRTFSDNRDLVVLHEVLHAMLLNIQRAQSDMVNEQAVVTLSELIWKLQNKPPVFYPPSPRLQLTSPPLVP